MTTKAAILAIAFACALVGADPGFARDPQSEGGATAEQLIAQALADDPSKEVTAQVYTFPPGTVLPWHVHTHQSRHLFTPPTPWFPRKRVTLSNTG